MSFDLFLNSYSRGRPAPANRESVEQFLVDSDVAVAGGRLVGKDADGNELLGFVQWRDGEPWTGGAQIIVRTLNQSVMDFVYGFAAAGRLGICNPQFSPPEPMWMLPPFVSPDDLPPGNRVTQPVVMINSGHDLVECLVPDFTSFEALTNAITDLFGDE